MGDWAGKCRVLLAYSPSRRNLKNAKSALPEPFVPWSVIQLE
jgi:hypothetical protein